MRSPDQLELLRTPEYPSPAPEPRDRVGESSAESFPASDAPAWSEPVSDAPLDRVQEASEDSFPASDAPSWTPITGVGAPMAGGNRPGPGAR